MVTYPTSIRRVIIIPLENKSRSTWIADSYIGSLTSKYGDATNFHGFSGISLPDYLMETSGSNQGRTTDTFTFCEFKVNNIYDVLTTNGLIFENFEEKTGSQGNHRHTPGYFYPSTCKGVQDMTMFMSKYVNGNQIPTNYSWLTPDFCHDGHDCPVSTVSTWLQNTLKLNTILSKSWFTDGSTLVVLVCDDGGSAGTPTLCLMMSTSSKGTKSNVSYKHSHVLSTVMWTLGLTGSIANSSASTAMKDLFGSTPPPPITYKCSGTPNYTCDPVTDGTGYATLAECQTACKPTQMKWKCSGTPNYTCVQTIDGIYNTQAECQTVCQPSSGTITITTPSAGLIYSQGEPRVVRWTHTTSTGPNVKIELLKASVSVKMISSNTPNDGAFAWTIPSVTSGIDYQIRIADLLNSKNTGISGNFTIK